MPVLKIFLPNSSKYGSEKKRRLLLDCSETYSAVLKSPIERVRVMIINVSAEDAAVAGQVCEDGGEEAPYFEFLVLQGRPIEECQELIEKFSDLLVTHLDVERSYVRGGCWPIPAEYWGVAGIPASDVRKEEIQSRK